MIKYEIIDNKIYAMFSDKYNCSQQEICTDNITNDICSNLPDGKYDFVFINAYGIVSNMTNPYGLAKCSPEDEFD